MYRCKSPAEMARRAANCEFYSDTVSELVYSDDPDEVVVVVDMNAPISPVTGMQVARIIVLPRHATSQEVAERIWELLDWGDIEGEEWVAPDQIDVESEGWDCRVKVFHH